MATITKRPSGKWQATVRKDGKSRSKSFSKRADATKWARETELNAESGGLQRKCDAVNFLSWSGRMSMKRDARSSCLVGKKDRHGLYLSARTRCVRSQRLLPDIPASKFADWHSVTARAAQHARDGTTWWHLNDLVPPLRRDAERCAM